VKVEHATSVIGSTLPGKKPPHWKTGAVVIACLFTAIVVVALSVPLANRFLWGKLGPLHLATQEGNGAECERLVRSGVPVDSVDGEGDTALDWAVYFCEIDVVRKLIELGADVNHPDQRGCTPLMYTATTLRGHFLHGTQEERNAVARVLIEHGANVNRASGDGQTPLHFAAADGNAGLVRMLLAAGANRNAKSIQGFKPLDVARFPGYAPNEEAIRALEAP
jgi:ankyrin repeat protein